MSRRPSRKGEGTEHDLLAELLHEAERDTLERLVLHLAAGRPDVRRQCFDFLKDALPSHAGEAGQGRAAGAPDRAADARARAETAAVLALWDEIEPELARIDENGGADWETADELAEQLHELADRLASPAIPRAERRSLVDAVLPYLESDRSGLDDPLLHVALAACHDPDDLGYLAGRLEACGREWLVGEAIRLYRRIGEHDKYLRLRQQRLRSGLEWYDLVTFYWERGEREKAVETARHGLRRAEGDRQPLRRFLADRAFEAGDRSSYLELQFQLKMEHPTAQGYRAFRSLCTEAEWAAYEAKVLAAMAKANPVERLKVHLLRHEYEAAIQMLSSLRYPGRWSSTDGEVLKLAEKLESRFPEPVLKFYMSGLIRLNAPATRTVYAEQAALVARLRHMWVDVLKTPDRWREFARQLKYRHLRWPAFQEEFAKVIPEWDKL